MHSISSPSRCSAPARRLRGLLVAMLVAAAPGVAIAQVASASGGGRLDGAGVPPDYGFTFATIGSPGNAAILAPIQTCQLCPPRLVGGVNYAYRMATTEVSATHWLDFVRAYAPFVPKNAAGSPSLIGFYGAVAFDGFNQQGLPTYHMPLGGENQPVDPRWQFGVRFINWLHNGRKPAGQTSASDFENGAYDLSLLGPNNLGPLVRNADALYWLPTLDEWVKAAYFDPNKNGPGQPGYWQYPITSDTAPISGNPAQGGQTNAGLFPPGQVRPLDIGSYPTVTSPWGLLDMSGGFSEWLETRGSGGSGDAYRIGSSIGYGLEPTVIDRLLWFLVSPGLVGATGLRVASAIPEPPMALIVFIPLSRSLCRRRR